MTLYDFSYIHECDFDTYDDVYDVIVTVSINLEPGDDYDEFCNELIKLVEVKKILPSGDPICGWTDLIKRNMDVFRQFSDKHWGNKYEDEDDFIYEWIEELHLFLAGYGEDGKYWYYKQEIVDKCN